MKIIVLIKQVPDTWGDRALNTGDGRLQRDASEPVLDEIDERAVEAALAIKDSDGAEVIALTMGPSAARDSLRKALALGADSAIHVHDAALAGADLPITSAVLAAALRRAGFDLIIAGNESTDGRGGAVAAMISEHLSVPGLTYLESVEIKQGLARGVRRNDYGTCVVRAVLPAVVSVTEAAPAARFPGFKGILRAKKKPVLEWSLADLDLQDTLGRIGRSNVRNVTQRAARMAGVKIVDDGHAAEELAEFLVSSSLI